MLMEGNVTPRVKASGLVVVGLLATGAWLAAQGGRGGVQVKPGEPCPPGTTEVRPGRCSAPEFPPPSIVDYRPRTTLVVAEHRVPSAKFPVIDSHNHTTVNAANIDQLIREMDELNLRVLVNLSGGSNPDAVKQKVDFIRASRHPDRFRVFANVAWNGAGGPGWAEKAVADLEQSIRNGAIGLKIAKDLGMFAKKADGSRLHVDDPALGADLGPLRPVERPRDHPHRRAAGVLLAARLRERALAGTGAVPGPPALRPGRADVRGTGGRAGPDVRGEPEDALHRRALRLVRERPRRAAEQLDRLPNLVLEVGAVLYDFGRQPRAAREFFIKYQDRILFGKDSYQASEFPYYWRVFETADEYFDYYRDYHAFWKLYGMDLPDAVLKKLYYQNALRVTPGLPQTGWPR